MKELTTEQQELLDAAKEAAKQAYAPYSGFKVGAALLCEDGSIFTGCNVENASYSLAICAERNAIFQAVSKGNLSYSAIAVYVDSDAVFPPCGACRQVISEFNPALPVIYGNSNGHVSSDMSKLLPGAFSLKK
jgi:cytidine deaminase